MQWLNNVVDEVIAQNPEGEIVVSSGVSPSGTYHIGTLREVLTAEAIAREIKRRDRQSRHVHVVDDLDVFRKVPADVDDVFSEYLGKPLCDVPSPAGDDQSYADYFLNDLLSASKELKLDMEIVRAHQKYRSGYFVSVIEKALDDVGKIKVILEDISGRELNDQWSPVQVVEDGYLKNRQFIAIDKDKQEITCTDKDGNNQQVSYAKGDVKLSWRIDWPARWSLLGVQVEPFGRDHATKGGSYDTGKRLVQEVFGGRAPVPVPYNFINRSGDTKKMSKSAGDTITATELLKVLPPEIVWYFILRYAPEKQLFFDQGPTLIRLVDEFAELIAKADKTPAEEQLIELCMLDVDQRTVSNVPFSHLVASYQASLKNPEKTLEVIERTEHVQTAKEQRDIILRELEFIDNWLKKWAPEDVKFDLAGSINKEGFSEVQLQFMKELSDKIENSPETADGEWFHQAIYELRDSSGLSPKELFQTIYKAIINKDSGPRAGWFLSILPKDWLIKRLRLEA